VRAFPLGTAATPRCHACISHYPKSLLMVTARADVTALPVTGQISRLTSRLEPTASLACTPTVRIRRDSSGMLRSVRASGACTGSRDAIHDMWAEQGWSPMYI